MNFLRRKWTALLFAAAFCLFAIPAIDKSLPLMRDIECYRAFFPKEAFQKRLKKPPADWMVEQLQKDFAPFAQRKITEKMVEKTFEKMYQTMGFLPEITHFRILDRKLYKFVPEGAPFSYRDTFVEKMIKTLLLYADVPDCDFVFCGMDGVPEPYVPANFYLVETPEEQAPVFAQAKRESLSPRYLVLIPDQFCLGEFWHRDSAEILAANEKIAWQEKQPKALWRGALSDTGQPSDGRFVAHYQTTPRFKLCELAAKHPEKVDAGLVGLDCKKIEAIAASLGLCKSQLSKTAHLTYKYLPILDGHMCTYPGYQWRLLSNSVCFKQESDQVQWFYGALKPYVHYIPVKNDMSDLLEKIEWAKEHDEEAAAIAQRATEFAANHLLPQDMYFYLRQAFLEYAKHQLIDFKELKKIMQSDPRWKCIQYRKQLMIKKKLNKLKNILTY